MFYKLVQRAYFTPERQRIICSSTSKYCCRNCCCVGDIFQVFWTCSLLKLLWADVFCLISYVIGIPIQVNTMMALLDLYPTHIDRYLTGHILIAAEASIAQL